MDEIDIEIDNDKINEDNNFNFNLGLNSTIKNYNDLEVKNQMKRYQIKNSSNMPDVDASNFSSVDFKNFDFNKNNLNEDKIKGKNFFDKDLDFDLVLTKSNFKFSSVLMK